MFLGGSLEKHWNSLRFQCFWKEALKEIEKLKEFQLVFLRNIENSMDLKNQIKINIKNISGIPGRALSVWDATYNLYWHRWNFMFRFSLKNKRKNDDIHSLSHFFVFLLILIFFIFLKKNDGETMDPDAFALSIPDHKSKLSLSSPR